MPLVDTLTKTMQQEADRMDVIANNLANTSTSGFKRMLMINDGTQCGTSPILAPGVVQQTGRSLDVSIEGNGFLVIRDRAGSEKLSRSGKLQVDGQGYLVTDDGARVQGRNGDVQIPAGAGSVSVTTAGAITAGGKTIDSLRLESPLTTAGLQPAGANCYVTVPPGATQAATCQVHQGSLEASNVSVISEMTSHIDAMRFFELNQKGLQMADSVLQKLTDDVGRSH